MGKLAEWLWTRRLCEEQAARISHLDAQNAKLRERLYQEIDANRRREDALVGAITQAALGERSVTPFHAPLANVPDEPPDPEDLELDEIAPNGVPEVVIQQRIKQYVIAAAERGAPYPPDAIEQLREKLRTCPPEDI